MIIAVDGPAAAGKGTLARGLARRLGFAHLDSGSLYRAVALKMMLDGADPADAETAIRAAAELDTALLEDPGLRGGEVAVAASAVAKIPQVRTNLLGFQRKFAEDPPGGALGAVIDGRDIGTVVCPDAAVKIFVTASDEERARRRSLELHGDDGPAHRNAVLEDLRRRDHHDRTRAVAPLKRAHDAHLLDTTNLDIEAALDRALKIIEDAGIEFRP